MPQKVTVEYDETTQQLIFLDENGQKVAAVRPSVFYHNPTKEEV